MKKFILFLAVCLTAVSVLQAQSVKKSPAHPVVSDPDAKAILDKVSAKFRSFTSVQARFAFRAEDAAGKTRENRSGTVLMKGNRYRISAGGDEMICDGSTLWNYSHEINEVQITRADEDAKAFTPQKLFSASYNKEFLYKLNGTYQRDGKTLQEIELTPFDKSRSYFKILLNIDKATQTVHSAKIFDKGGARYVYTVISLSGNVAAPDSRFVFDTSKHPGVEVVDLR